MVKRSRVGHAAAALRQGLQARLTAEGGGRGGGARGDRLCRAIGLCDMFLRARADTEEALEVLKHEVQLALQEGPRSTARRVGSGRGARGARGSRGGTLPGERGDVHESMPVARGGGGGSSGGHGDRGGSGPVDAARRAHRDVRRARPPSE